MGEQAVTQEERKEARLRLLDRISAAFQGSAPTLSPRQIRELEKVVWSRRDCPVLARLFGWGARVFILRDRLAVVR